MAMSTCSDPIIMSPQALKPLALQIGDAGTANQIVMVIERKLREVGVMVRGGTTGGCSGIANLSPSPNPYRTFVCFFAGQELQRWGCPAAFYNRPNRTLRHQQSDSGNLSFTTNRGAEVHL